MAEPLRIGILGASRIGELSLVSPAAVTGHRLVAVAARNRDRAQQWADDHGVERVLDSYEAVLADPEVEAIYNPLPNSLHGLWNLRAIEAGKHVLSEKPFESTARDAGVVVAAGRSAQRVVVEAFHYPFHPNFSRLIELVGSGVIGDLRHVRAPMDMPAPADDDPRWSFDLAGGALMDVGCYALHCARQLGRFAGGEPTVVSAQATGSSADPRVDSRVSARLAYPSGATADIGGSMDADVRDFSLTVVGSRGRIHLPNFPLPHVDDALLWTDSDGTEHEEHHGTRSSYVYQLESFAAAVRDGVPLPYDDASEQAAAIEAVYAAAGLPARPSALDREVQSSGCQS